MCSQTFRKLMDSYFWKQTLLLNVQWMYNVYTHIVLVGSSDWLPMWICRITCICSIRCHDGKCFQTFSIPIKYEKLYCSRQFIIIQVSFYIASFCCWSISLKVHWKKLCLLHSPRARNIYLSGSMTSRALLAALKTLSYWISRVMPRCRRKLD